MCTGHRNKGFSLIEILVSMALMSLVLFMVTGPSFSSRKNMDQYLSRIERIIRFSADESVLNNYFLRLSLNLEEDPTEINLEYSSDLSLVIDPELEKAKLIKKEIDDETPQKRDSFSRHEEFEPEDFEAPVGVKIIGMATGLSNKLITDQNAPLYFYPTGEKDSAIILFATDDEMAYLEINPFSHVIKRKYISYDESLTEENYSDVVEKMASDIYKEWINN